MEKSSKKVFITFGLAFCALVSFAQPGKINAEQASKHVGDSLNVCGKVYGGIYLEKSKGQPTLINVGAAYPKNPLTLVIFQEARSLFKNAPETYYKDSSVFVTGKITLYNEKPQIVITKPAQVSVQH